MTAELTPAQRAALDAARKVLAEHAARRETGEHPSNDAADLAYWAARDHRALQTVAAVFPPALKPEPPADLEAEECGHSDDPAYTCDALSGHGGNHTAHGPGDVVYHVWKRS